MLGDKKMMRIRRLTPLLILFTILATSCNSEKLPFSSTSKSDESHQWQRMKECAAQADRMVKRGLVEGAYPGFEVSNQITHYSRKYQRCYVEVFLWAPDENKAGFEIDAYSRIYDAFEGKEVSSCIDPSYMWVNLLRDKYRRHVICSDWDCVACTAFETDRMNN